MTESTITTSTAKAKDKQNVDSNGNRFPRMMILSMVVLILAVVWQKTAISTTSKVTTLNLHPTELLSSITTTFRSIFSKDECSFDFLAKYSFSLEDDDNDVDSGSSQSSEPRKRNFVRQPYYGCTDEDLSNFLHDDSDNDEVNPGMHLVCLHRHNRSITFFRGSSRTKSKTISFDTTTGSLLYDVGDLHETMKFGNNNNNDNSSSIQWQQLTMWAVMSKVFYAGLELDTSAPQIVPYGPEQPRENWKHQFAPPPWAVFSLDGHRLIDQDSSVCTTTRPLWENGMVLVMEGGQFVWPGVRVGFEREVSLSSIGTMDAESHRHDHQNPSARNVTLTTLSLRPLMFSVVDYLEDDECTYLRDKAQPKLKYSDAILRDGDDGATFSGLRTSSFTVMNVIEPQLQQITRRTAWLVRAGETHLEPMAVSKYRIGEYYGPHHDYFEPTMYKRDPSTLRLIRNGYRNRMISVFLYLSDIPPTKDTDVKHDAQQQQQQQQQQQINNREPMNGVTTFPLVPAIPIDDACTTGIQISPQKGRVVIMYNLHADGSIDHSTLNADCPVQRGVKWTANIWVWNQPVIAARYA